MAGPIRVHNFLKQIFLFIVIKRRRLFGGHTAGRTQLGTSDLNFLPEKSVQWPRLFISAVSPAPSSRGSENPESLEPRRDVLPYDAGRWSPISTPRCSATISPEATTTTARVLDARRRLSSSWTANTPVEYPDVLSVRFVFEFSYLPICPGNYQAT